MTKRSSSPSKNTGDTTSNDGDPGSTGSGPWEPIAFLVRPADPSNQQKATATELRARFDLSGLKSVELVGERLRGMDGALDVLRPSDVERLYKTLHKRKALVLATGGVRVQRDVSANLTRRGSVPAEQFVRHKAFFALVSRPEEASRSINQGVEWLTRETDIDGPHDPRCLPMLCFAGCREIPLSNPSDRKRFRQDFGKARRDSFGGEWQGDGPYHTRDTLHVAGLSLPVGFHWDVQAWRPFAMCNGWERWEIRANGYLNVHPDAHLRGSKNVTRTHPKPTR